MAVDHRGGDRGFHARPSGRRWRRRPSNSEVRASSQERSDRHHRRAFAFAQGFPSHSLFIEASWTSRLRSPMGAPHRLYVGVATELDSASVHTRSPVARRRDDVEVAELAVVVRGSPGCKSKPVVLLVESYDVSFTSALWGRIAEAVAERVYLFLTVSGHGRWCVRRRNSFVRPSLGPRRCSPPSSLNVSYARGEEGHVEVDISLCWPCGCLSAGLNGAR